MNVIFFSLTWKFWNFNQDNNAFHQSVCVVFPEGGTIGQSVAERHRVVIELQALLKVTGFPFHIVPLEQVSVDAGDLC